MALLVMFNNFFHDFTAALWLSTTLLIIYLNKQVQMSDQKEVKRFYVHIFPGLFKASVISLVLNLILGVFRAVAFYNFEYLPAAGKGQVTALVFKHILIFGIVIAGLVLAKKVQSDYKHLRRTLQNG